MSEDRHASPGRGAPKRPGRETQVQGTGLASHQYVVWSLRMRLMYSTKTRVTSACLSSKG